MVNEIIDRVNLIVMTQGSRRISKENLEFMFAKYELNVDERQQILDYCEDNRIEVFAETEEALAEEASEKASAQGTLGEVLAQGTSEEKKNSGSNRKKGGFFSKLFGKK